MGELVLLEDEAVEMVLSADADVEGVPAEAVAAADGPPEDLLSLNDVDGEGLEVCGSVRELPGAVDVAVDVLLGVEARLAGADEATLELERFDAELHGHRDRHPEG